MLNAEPQGGWGAGMATATPNPFNAAAVTQPVNSFASTAPNPFTVRNNINDQGIAPNPFAGSTPAPNPFSNHNNVDTQVPAPNPFAISNQVLKPTPNPFSAASTTPSGSPFPQVTGRATTPNPFSASKPANPVPRSASPKSILPKVPTPESNGIFSATSVQKNGQNGRRSPARGIGSGSEIAVLPGMTRTSKDDHDGRSRELALKIQRQLSKDRIRPPQWPANPGSHAQRQAMDSFRESYRAYREKARKSLIRAGLIDDPDRRRKLDQALDFRGISDDMCPEWEKITRITEYDVRNPEKALDSSGDLVPIPKLMVKRLARSAAGQDAPLPMDVRSFATLRRTLDYLIDDLIPNDSLLPSKHNFLWDRTRAIRIDLSVQKYNLTKDERIDLIYCLETIARFHVTSLHLLSQEGFAAEDFSEQQEIEQLGKTLMSLKELYDDCTEQGVECGNEAEFRAYYIVFNARNPSIKETVEGWGTRLWDSDEIRTAMCLVESLQNTWALQGPLNPYAPTELALGAAAMFFSIVSSPQISYTMACFAEIHFNDVRKTMLRIIRKSYSRPREGPKDITPAFLKERLRFDTEEEAVDFAQKHGFEFGQDGDHQYAILNTRQPIKDPRIRHAFSRAIVESKRAGRSLPHVIHHTVYQEQQDGPRESPQEESLFVADPVDKSVHAPERSLVDVNETDSSIITTSSSVLGTVSSKSSPSITKSSPLKDQFGSAATSPNVGHSVQDSKFQVPAAPLFIAPTPTQNGYNEAASNANQFLPPKAGKEAPSVPTLLRQPSTGTLTPSAGAVRNSVQISVPAPPKQNTFGSIFAPRNQNDGSSNLATTQPASTPIFGIQQKSASSIFKSRNEPTPTATKPTSATIISLESSSAPTQPQSLSFPSSLPIDKRPPALTLADNKVSVTDQPSPSLSPKPTVTFTPPSGQQATVDRATPAPIPPVTPALLGPIKPTTVEHTTSVAAPVTTMLKIDPMDKFARWILLADKGLMEDLLEPLAVEHVLKSTWEEFKAAEEERIRQEKDEKSWAEALKFRHYNLKVRYFYRWLDTCRKRRVVKRIQLAKEEARKWKSPSSVAEREAAERAKKEKDLEEAKELVRMRTSRHSEDVSRLRESTRSNQSLEEALLATGVFSGVRDERAAARRATQDDQTDSISEISPSATLRLRSENQRRRKCGLPPLKRFPEATYRKDGSKTALLRAISSGRDSLSMSTGSLRNSTFSSSYRSSLGFNHGRVRKSQASVKDPYWRLKANGLVQMPNGEYLHESLALPMLREGKRFPGIGDYGLPPVKSYPRSETPPADLDIAQDSASPSPTPSRFEASNETTRSPSALDGVTQKRKRGHAEDEDLAAYRNEAPATRKRAKSSDHSTSVTPGGDPEFLASIASLLSRVDEVANSSSS